MYDRYMITGASGFLGRAVAKELVSRGAQVYALVLPGDPLAEMLPREAHVMTGDICVKNSLNHFFLTGADKNTCLIHCAGVVSVETHPKDILYQVNVIGARNIILMCSEYNIERMIYVSSVHAMPEKPKGRIITEQCDFSPMLVHGEYAKSKAAATEMVFDAIQQGLKANVIFPSGIIGPGDLAGGSFTTMVNAFLAGKMPFSVKGGYDFVDVRDVATGIVDCSEDGVASKGYILSGHYISIEKMLDIAGKIANLKKRPIPLPLSIARLAAPHFERYCLKKSMPAFFTPYSVSVLGSNGKFSHAAATKAFSYQPRPIEETLEDMTAWLISQKE